jgi:hypothetical protein
MVRSKHLAGDYAGTAGRTRWNIPFAMGVWDRVLQGFHVWRFKSNMEYHPPLDGFNHLDDQ